MYGEIKIQNFPIPEFYVAYNGTDSLDEAFNKAREECILQGYLKVFIEKEDFIVFYKDILDYDTQLREEGEAKGGEKAICVAIRSNVPLAVIETMAKETNVSQKRLSELLEQVAV